MPAVFAKKFIFLISWPVVQCIMLHHQAVQYVCLGLGIYHLPGLRKCEYETVFQLYVFLGLGIDGHGQYCYISMILAWISLNFVNILWHETSIPLNIIKNLKYPFDG